MPNPYLSSTRWQKLRAGLYVSPDRRYEAFRSPHGSWGLYARRYDSRRGRDLVHVGSYLTLADCQEAAERYGSSL